MSDRIHEEADRDRFEYDLSQPLPGMRSTRRATANTLREEEDGFRQFASQVGQIVRG